MQMLLTYAKEYWVLLLIFLLAVVLLIFVSSKAGKAVARTRREREALIKKLDRMKFIRETYSDLTEEKILSDDGKNLIDGVTDNIQQRLEKNEDMAEAFGCLNEEEKTIYAFFWFLDEAEKSPSEFFRAYTYPLTPYALSACKIFLSQETYELIKQEYDRFDEENETVSVIDEEIEKLDEKIAHLLDFSQAKQNASDYIKKNVLKFV